MLQKIETQLIPLHNTPLTKGDQMIKLLLVVLFIGLSSVGNAQLQYGLKVNAGVSCQSDMLELANNCNIRFSPSVGLLGKYKLSEGFAIKSGLEYLQKGSSFQDEGNDLSNKLQYINLLAQAEFSAGEKAGFKNGQRIFFSVGPYLSYLLDAKGELSVVSFNLKNDTKDFDFGLSFELGVEFRMLENKALQLGLNYGMGFVEVYKSEPDLHNKTVSISLALFF